MAPRMNAIGSMCRSSSSSWNGSVILGVTVPLIDDTAPNKMELHFAKTGESSTSSSTDPLYYYAPFDVIITPYPFGGGEPELNAIISTPLYAEGCA